MLKKILKWILLSMLGITILAFLSLNIYARNYYHHLDEMDTAIDDAAFTNVTTVDSRRFTTYTVDNPIANIVFIPGGLVEPVAYEYLLLSLAEEGYNVTLFKPFYNLAILSPNFAARYLDEDLDNIIIGHSLGGVVASMVASGNNLVDQVILLGSYPIQDLSDKDVLIISAEHDDNMDQEEFDNSLENVNEDAVLIMIDGGNHAQFGWYGPQAGDGDADITTLEQQTIVINIILDFIN